MSTLNRISLGISILAIILTLAPQPFYVVLDYADQEIRAHNARVADEEALVFCSAEAYRPPAWQTHLHRFGGFVINPNRAGYWEMQRVALPTDRLCHQ